MGKRTLLKFDNHANRSLFACFLRMLHNDGANAAVEYSIVLTIFSTIVSCFFMFITMLIPIVYQENIQGMQKIQSCFIQKLP